MTNGWKGLIRMRCENCGGTLKLVNGTYECEHCHSRYAKDPLYENTEVAICYVEVDDFGRRTKDSLIAQNVYAAGRPLIAGCNRSLRNISYINKVVTAEGHRYRELAA